jgi:HEAT repeat protein
VRSRKWGISAAREATVQICDSDGEHRGQGLLLAVANEGTFVLTCHHVVAPLAREGIFVRVPGRDGRLGDPIQAQYDEERSRAEVDAVVLCLKAGYENGGPLLRELDAGYQGNLSCTVLTHREPNSFDATVSVSTQIDISSPVPSGDFGHVLTYKIPAAFRLAKPTEARKGVSGGVVVCDGVVLGLAESARGSTTELESEVYMLPLSTWAENWSALSSEIEPFNGADPFQRSLQDYLRALSIFSANLPYLALDKLLTGSQRTLGDVYIPLRARRLENLNHKNVVEKRLDVPDDVPDKESTIKHGLKSSSANTAIMDLADILGNATNTSERSCALLRGPAGAGKSTLLYHIAANAYQRPYAVGLSRPYLPLILRLEDIAKVTGASFEERLVNTFSRAGELPLLSNPPTHFFEQWPRRENLSWLLLFDGLDEVPVEKRTEVLRWMRDLLASFGNERPPVVLTSRPGDKELTEELKPRFAIYDVLPFDDDQQREFANRWFEDRGSHFLQKLQRVLAISSHREPPAITPLLLTISAAVYHRDGDLPEASWIELYGEFIKIVFAEARRGLTEDLGADVADLARSGLELIAARMTAHPDENSLSDITKVIVPHLRQELGWGTAMAEERANQFSEVITRRIGVLFRQGEICHWTHSKIREHLAAQALDHQLRTEHNDYTKVIGELLFDDKWYDVLLILCRLHNDQHSLLRWMAEEVIARMNGESSLLVYDCLQLTDASVRADLQPLVVRALTNGFGDRQAHNFVYEGIREYLIGMGSSIVETLVEILHEYQGLQRRLLPECTDEKTRPDFYKPPGDLIHMGYLIRMKVIKTLGEIGHELAVEPLIEIITNRDTVDSFRPDITRQSRRALRCIGAAAVEPLLKRVSDTALPASLRSECLTALCAVGLRSREVSRALRVILREGLRNNLELLSHALQVATLLRDRTHQSHAIRALEVPDVRVVRDAARYLAEMPCDSAFIPLRNALMRWRYSETEDFDHRWTLKYLVAGLAATGKHKSRRLTLNLFEKNLSGTEQDLTPGAVVQDAAEAHWPAIGALLLHELKRRLENPSALTPTFLIDSLTKQIASTWRPTQIKALGAATHALEFDSKKNTNFANLLIRTLKDRQVDGETNEHPEIRIESSVVLRTLAKCQVENFAGRIGELLRRADYSFERELCDALWVTEDKAAESQLIAKLKKGIASRRKTGEAEPEEYHVLRALSTCSTKRGAKEAIGYIRNNPDLSIYLPEDVLCPLVKRGVVSAATLARMAQDLDGTHVYVRRQCVEALGYLDAPRYSDPFVKVLQDETDEQARGYAAAFLGWSKGGRRSPVRALCRALSLTESAFLAERAGQSLVRLKKKELIPLIEQAIERFGTPERASGLLRAVARFRSESTLSILMRGISTVGRSPIVHREILSAVGEFYSTSDWARSFVRAELENARAGIDLGEQRDAVAVLAVHDPNWLVVRAVELFDSNRLDRSAALTLIAYMRRITESRPLKQSGLVGILKRLICDEDLDIREAAAESLVFVNKSARQRLYRELATTRNDWARACAVYSMAFWDSDLGLIESARFDQSPVTRYLANVALTIRSKRSALKQVSRTFRTSTGVARTSAFFALAEQASESHVTSLYREIKEGELARIFLRDLADDVKRRVKDERQKRSKEEADRFCERVRRVTFT